MSDPREVIERGIELTRKQKFEQALPLFAGAIPELGASDDGKKLLSSCFSYYGLCIAKVERQYGKAVQCCKISVSKRFRDGDHWANFALVYLEANDRKKAVETILKGLKRDPGNRALAYLQKSLGVRRPPVLSFLSRDNPLNVFLGKALRGGFSSKD